MGASAAGVAPESALDRLVLRPECGVEAPSFGFFVFFFFAAGTSRAGTEDDDASPLGVSALPPPKASSFHAANSSTVIGDEKGTGTGS